MRCFVATLLVCLGFILEAQSVSDSATSVRNISAPKDFRVELLYSVPKLQQGSWVAMCNDDKGRIIVSDQFGGLHRFTPPASGKKLKSEDIEPIPAKIRAAKGLLWANGGLYVAVNTDMFNPNQRVNINRPEVESIEPSKVSPMPPGLLNLMQEDEVMDLLAYILSSGNPSHPLFK